MHQVSTDRTSTTTLTVMLMVGALLTINGPMGIIPGLVLDGMVAIVISQRPDLPNGSGTGWSG